jgi:hypothetical protein
MNRPTTPIIAVLTGYGSSPEAVCLQILLQDVLGHTSQGNAQLARPQFLATARCIAGSQAGRLVARRQKDARAKSEKGQTLENFVAC